MTFRFTMIAFYEDEEEGSDGVLVPDSAKASQRTEWTGLSYADLLDMEEAYIKGQAEFIAIGRKRIAPHNKGNKS